MMKTKKINLTSVLILLAAMAVSAQSVDTTKAKSATQSFSLDEAQKFAVNNSPVLKNSNLDLEIAKKKIWETTAIGLPQVNGKVAASYILQLPALYSEFSGLSSLGSVLQTMGKIEGMLAHNAPVSDSLLGSLQGGSSNLNSMKWGLTADLTVSQLLFSGAYLVGLQTSKAFKGMNELSVTKSTKDLAESISNAYHLVLVMQENKTIMDSIFLQTQKTSIEMDAMYKNGFIEQTAVDQIKLTVNNLKNTLSEMANQINVSKNLLRLQMGLEMKTDFVLTDKLDNMLAQSIQLSLLSGDLNVDKNTDFQIVQNATKLNELQLKYQESSLLPDIAAFYQFDHQFNSAALTFTPPQMIGASMNIPIFGSGAKISRINQAKLSVTKSKNTEFQVSQALKLSYSQAKTSYGTALDKLDANKDNLELSKRIYDKTLIKFKNGVASSMELTQSQSQLLQAQSSYYSTIIELVNAKNALDKLMK